jgi:dUTPase
MTEAINAHKKMAMGITSGNAMKKGGKVQKYAAGGAVAESKAAKLPAMGDRRNAGVDFNAGKTKIATMKKGGAMKSGLTIAVAIPVKRMAGRSR